MKYSIMTYVEVNGRFNIGDYIQSLAAKQFLPKVDFYTNREQLGSYEGEKAKIILNGWFTHEPNTWIPSQDLNPLFISFHINSSAASRILSSKGVNYLKQHEPIGCRDYYTASLLKEKNIKSYFSGCLTLTLDSYTRNQNANDGKVYIVDPLYGFPNKERIFSNYRSLIKSIWKGDILKIRSANSFMKKMFSHKLLDNAIYIKHELPANKYTEDEKFAIAEDLLNKYSKAKLVITSRIHCALPCLAMGTPVIYINGFEKDFDSCRMEGLSELFNTIEVNRKTGEIKSNFGMDGLITEDTIIKNKQEYKILANILSETVSNFINKK